VAATFVQAGSFPLWKLESGPAACQIFFVPFELPAPATLTLAETLAEHPGAYAIVPTTPSLDATVLAERLAVFLRLHPTVRIAWIENPGDDPRAWRATTVTFDRGGATAGLSPVAFNNIALWIGAGCLAQPDEAGEALVLTPPPGRTYLTAGFGASSFPLEKPISLCFGGEPAGCLTTTASLDLSTALDDLDVGMRIFSAESGKWPVGRLLSWRFPLLRPAATTISADLALDPLGPLDPDRTYFGLVPQSGRAPELGSYYVTANGGSVALTPLPTPLGKLVLSPRALANPCSPFDPYCLVPSGAFAIRVLGAGGKELDGQQRLMCGISAVEYVTLEQPGSEIWFAPGGAALVGEGKGGLEGAAVTSYASVFGPEGARLGYHAQPDDSTLYRPTATAGVLEYHELGGIELPAAPSAGPLPSGFPLLPFAGVDAATASCKQSLELQKVSPARRALLQKDPYNPAPAPPSASDEPLETTTRQGLLATLTGESMGVQLAQSDGGANKVELELVSAALESALQSNQLFLVASEAASLGTGVGTGKLTIGTTASDRWTLDVFPEKPPPTPPLIVFKFAGKPLEALAADLSAWTGAEDFNPKGGVQGVQERLLKTIADAKRRARTDSDYQPFAALAEDPTWQGILVLGCDVPLDALPEQLAGLAAGIDPSLFAAHHVGVTVTPVRAEAGSLTVRDSAIFGLIDYVSPHTAAAGAPPYAFVVEALKVRFANSAVVDFSSRIQLLVGELFHEPSTLLESGKPAPHSVLVLDGVYQVQGGVGAYSFHTLADHEFKLDSAVLARVDVAAAQFVTVKAPCREKTSEEAVGISRFSLAGSIGFQPPPAANEGFDLFSFGPDGKGLAVSNLAIDLTYYPDNPAKPNVFRFDASEISFDPAQSAARPEGLFASFPLTPSAMLQVDAGGSGTTASPPTPATLGFLGVGAQAASGTISAPWFGLAADLGLGTAGALAAAAGFKATLLAAWSPGKGSTPNVAVGLKLPGTGGGGKLLSLESVLKLKIAELTLDRAGKTYVLQLDRIALSLLTLSFPPSGQTELLLFADPAGSDHTTLGWFAGYAKTGGGT
jgi:hypothetical protein